MWIRTTCLFCWLALPAAAGGELVQGAADGMYIQHRFEIDAPLDRVWDSLVHPERWWPSGHTWSGSRAALSLEPTAGGCFCERWEQGSVEHGRVIMSMPGRLLRLSAALGPLQEMAVSGVLTIALTEQEGATAATVSYRVSGDAAHKLDDFAAVVDQVIGEQFGAFARDAGGQAK